MKRINCDLGECLKPEPDAEVMPLIDMANIACGGHAGDENSIVNTIRLALRFDVTIGVHPSYVDSANFGRVSHELTAEQLQECISEQVDKFAYLCRREGAVLSYVKPHGALYHDMMQKPGVLNTICDFLVQFYPHLSLVVQAGINHDDMVAKSAETGITFIYEAFADRAYDGNLLVPRSQAGAMLIDPEQIVAQYHLFSDEPYCPVDTVCFHSDHEPSVSALKLLKGH